MTSGKAVTAETGDGERTLADLRPAWIRRPGGNREPATIGGDSVPPDDAFEILRNPRRRHAIRILSRCDGPIGLTELAREVASIENDKEPDDVSAAERKRVYISLYQCHVSKMEDAGIITYDDEERIVGLARSGGMLADVLDSYSAESGSGLPLSPAVAVAAFGLSVASFYVARVDVAMLFLGIGISFSVFSYRAAGG